MQKKHFFNASILVVALVASFLVVKATDGAAKTVKPNPTCCKKIDKSCTEAPGSESPAKIGLENLSHQFISVPGFLY